MAEDSLDPDPQVLTLMREWLPRSSYFLCNNSIFPCLCEICHLIILSEPYSST